MRKINSSAIQYDDDGTPQVQYDDIEEIEEQPTTGIQWCVVISKDLSRDGKVGLDLRLIDKDNYDLSEVRGQRFYLASAFKGTVGDVYSYEYLLDKPTSFLPNSVTWQGQWPDENARTIWRTKAEVFDTIQRRKAEAKKSNTGTIKQVMAPLRKVWKSATYSERIALEALVLHYLQTGEIE